jgi:uncharacterized glyoxalase superfamily protein PhnB
MATTTKAPAKPKSQASSKAKAEPVPHGMHTVTPHLMCDGAAAAIDFYKKAFGAEELMRLPGENGKLMHACIKIGDSAVMLADIMADCGDGSLASKGGPIVLHLYVADADAFVKKAEAAGAKIIMPVTDMFWGDRYGQLEDPFGHRWAVATHVRDLSQDEIQEGGRKMMAEMKR